MSTISSIISDITYPQNTSAEISASGVVIEGDESSSPEVSTEESGSNIELSTRAQKIQKLNEEFFPSGPQDLRITGEFINRLEEYGLISSSEASNLGELLDASEQQEASSFDELSQFVESFSAKLRDDDPDHTLLSTLEKAQSIIADWESNNPSVKTDLKAVIAELFEFNTSDEAQALDVNDRRSLLELELAMNIADEVNQSSDVSDEINSYLDVLNQTN